MKSREVISELRSRASPADLEGMVRRGLATAAQQRGREIVVVLFLDTKKQIQPIRLSSQDPVPRLVKAAAVEIERIRAVARGFISAIAYANPVADNLNAKGGFRGGILIPPRLYG